MYYYRARTGSGVKKESVMWSETCVLVAFGGIATFIFNMCVSSDMESHYVNLIVQ